MRKIRTALSSVVRAERGSIMIEAMVSAVVLVVVALGVLKALDTSSVASANLKRRAVAASVAQKDQERLRAMLASDLSNLDQTRTVLSNGITFSVHSTAIWITDAGGTADCTTNAKSDYLKITSTASWQNIGVIHPATEESIVSPPAGSFSATEGAIGATVRDASGVGVPGVDVAAAGPDTASGVTNDNGCVLLGHLPVGTYTVQISQAGWVGRQGVQTLSLNASVTAQTTNSVSFDYDRAAAIDATFDTDRKRLNATGGTFPPEPATADRVRVGNSGLAAPFYRTFGTVGTQAALISAEPLFPFTDPYSIYAGDCDWADPAVRWGEPASLASAPAGGRNPETVRLPAMDLQVARKIGSTITPLDGAHVVITSKSSGCTEVFRRATATITPVGGTVAQAVSGLLDKPGLPYGLYDVCVDDAGTTGTLNRKTVMTGVQLADPVGTNPFTLQIDTTSANTSTTTPPTTTTYSSGACP